MKVLVTGGSGFVGTNLIGDLLSQGHEVLNYDIEPSEGYAELTQINDVRDCETLTRSSQGVDAIVHLAAEHRDDVRPTALYYDVNVNGAECVVKAAERNGVDTIVFTSSVAVYGLDGGIPNEASPVRPFNDYGRSKHKAEQVFKRWADADPARRLVIVRPCVVFGENNRGNVYTLLKQIDSGRFLAIGAGQNRKSMAYVKNVSHFLVRCLQLDSGFHIFNYADSPDLTTTELIELTRTMLGKKRPPRIPYALGLAGGYLFDFMAGLTGKTFPISSVRVRKFCADTRISTQQVQALGIKPVYSLKDGLHRMIAHEFPGKEPPPR